MHAAIFHSLRINMRKAKPKSAPGKKTVKLKNKCLEKKKSDGINQTTSTNAQQIFFGS